jgi:hypothetical protein
MGGTRPSAHSRYRSRSDHGRGPDCFARRRPLAPLPAQAQSESKTQSKRHHPPLQALFKAAKLEPNVTAISWPKASVRWRSEAKGVPNATEEVSRGRDVVFSPGGWTFCSRLQKADDLWWSYAARYAIHRRVANGTVGIDNEQGRLCDAAPLAGVVDVPFPNHPPRRVAQDHERQPQVPPHRFGRLRRIDRYADNISAGGPDFVIVVAIIRQLAEAEGSPMSAVEEEY